MVVIAANNKEKASWIRSSIRTKQRMLDEYNAEIKKYDGVIADLQREVDSLRGVASEIEIGIRRSEALLSSYTKKGQ